MILLRVMQAVRVLHGADVVVVGIYQPEKNFHSHSVNASGTINFYRTERLIYEIDRKLLTIEEIMSVRYSVDY